MATPEGLEVEAGRVREQEQREGELCDVKGRAVSDVDVDHVESVRPNRHAECHKKQRSRKHGILEPPGEQRICERGGRQQRQGGHGRGNLSGSNGDLRITRFG